MTDIKPARALLSVSDKTGLLDFAKALAAHGVELISTGGTARALAEAGLKVTDVATLTGFPEMMDGRLKTLHPNVHGGLLMVRGNAEHEKAAKDHGIASIDLLVVNLYPFEETLKKNAPHDEMIENIDVGGPAMIRGASKNHDFVTVVTDPSDYQYVLSALDKHGAIPKALREVLAAKAFARTSAYDAAIASYLARHIGESAFSWGAMSTSMKEVLRYGENPHQTGSLWLSADPRPGVASARQIQGKELSYNNINDTDAAFELVAEFDPSRTAACAIIKHANPCGVAEGANLADAYRRALASDPVSAFGGIIALNRALDAETATEIVKIFTEVIIAPDASDEAIKILGAKKNLRLLLTGGLPDPRAAGLTFKSVAGGLLMQSRDDAVVDDADLKVVTKRQPTNQELTDLLFAYRVVKHVKSNAIVFAKSAATVGIGAGQMSRVDAARIAVLKAEEIGRDAGAAELPTRGSVVASDAFFPFADGLITAAEAGATAAIQPGGSVKDQEVIEAADSRGMAMIMTGVRHFRH
ncbi:bifunctional purine biosynthesis protein PurH [Terrihabitans soli]|uniref:Bifunctional purine biosynthesis protein PurH n=1 Tax=Terrihabitans soli TaxID=708113 RepID=A0A6S6QQE2_9HYPH|nr:bifunctional phosphoribosylaminoimidazolecarboxamide formyltransferase/IMP cyclohydrolase [Terrihabitans soli]BCJ89502.1 bifunctional purine biosynthesis protein PurH [Terrihabitans soli]